MTNYFCNLCGFQSDNSEIFRITWRGKTIRICKGCMSDDKHTAPKLYHHLVQEFEGFA